MVAGLEAIPHFLKFLVISQFFNLKFSCVTVRVTDLL